MAADHEPTWVRVVEDALAHPGDAQARARTWERVEGREEAYFHRLFAQAAKESRAIESVLNEAATRVVIAGRVEAARRLIERVAHQACCRRGSYLAATVEGIVAGLEILGDRRLSGIDTVRQVDSLTRHVDPEVAAAARGLRPWLTEATR